MADALLTYVGLGISAPFDRRCGVPLYYFDIQDVGGFHRDEIGDNFDTLEEAVNQAQSLLPDIARDIPINRSQSTIVCFLRNEIGRLVYRGSLTFVIVDHFE